MTGRTNNRDCIDTALPCCNEDPAPTCSMGKLGGLPHTEFTIAKAAKKSKLGDYATIQLGKWHLGDLWDKKLPGMSPEKFSVSNPGRTCDITQNTLTRITYIRTQTPDSTSG